MDSNSGNSGKYEISKLDLYDIIVELPGIRRKHFIVYNQINLDPMSDYICDSLGEDTSLFHINSCRLEDEGEFYHMSSFCPMQMMIPIGIIQVKAMRNLDMVIPRNAKDELEFLKNAVDKSIGKECIRLTRPLGS